MAELSTRYAVALYDLASESGLLEDFVEQVGFLREALESGEFMRIIKHPAISGDEKRRFISESLSGRIHDDLLGFLYLAIEKNREEFILPSLSEFISLSDRLGGRVVANVVSAAELDETQALALKNMLSKKLNKHVEISTTVDPSVLGGLYIHVDGLLLDHTVKKRLTDMKDTLKRSTPNDFHA